MKINYLDNPLVASIELSEYEDQILKHRIEIKILKEWLYDVHYDLEKPEYSLDEIKKTVNAKRYYSDDGPSLASREVLRMFGYLKDALTESHAGDCTCFPFSCMKCQVEQYLGINTTQGLGKHEGNKVYNAFKLHPKFDDALAHLESKYPFVPTEDWHHPHVERWDREAKSAIAWMKAYKEKIGTTETRIIGVYED